MARQLQDYAQFYPSLNGLTKGHIVCPDGEQVRVLFTNDIGTAGYDLRHLIDFKTMRDLPHGASLEASLTAPQPVCRRITGKGMDQQSIVGMLGEPLEVKVKLHDKVILLRLEQVLVVDRLPVPLHISMQRLGEGANDLDELTNAMQNRDHSIHVAFNRPSVGGSVYEPMDLTPPPPPQGLEEFRDHPYWTGSSMYLGHAGETHDALQQHIAAEAVQTGPAVQSFICPVCGVAEKLKRCGKCLSVWYCSKEHQKEHWKVHKHVCR
jgi:hypothetical protein